MFPSTIFRQAYDRLLNDDPGHASRRYLEILEWAALNSEAAMESALRRVLDDGDELDFDWLVELSACPVAEPLEIDIPLPDMAAYDGLFEEATV